MTLLSRFDASQARPVLSPIEDATALHQDLAHWNRRRLSPGAPSEDWAEVLAEDERTRLVEGAMVEAAREPWIETAAATPTDVDGFVDWFEGLKGAGPGENDPLFPWLAEEADLESMRWFLQQEVAGEAGFDDLVALTQVKMPTSAKLELARNYWDEMGRGNEGGMHGPMLGRLSEALNLNPTIEGTVWPALALGNLLVAFATNRRYAWHAVGALGAVELTAPWRAGLVADGLKRLGVGKERQYYALHSTLDVKHSEDWNREILRPVMAETPEVGRWIAEGALMRLAAGAACYDAYRAHLWGEGRVRA
jgi:hypothetical protein